MIVAGACGRWGIDRLSPPDAAKLVDADPADALDPTPLPVCSENPTVCGDGCCIGNNGEMCSTCMADCATKSPVCGNGACDPGETSANCYVDCGPTPWPWTGDENTLVILVNQARTGGTKCPGMAFATAPALTVDPSLTPGTRENVWEIAHQGFATGPGTTCNGRTLTDLFVEFNFNGQTAFWSGGAITPQNAVSGWLGNSGLCPILMSSGATAIGVAAAHDMLNAYMVRVR
jgi:uncharacterized protein YkwD